MKALRMKILRISAFVATALMCLVALFDAPVCAYNGYDFSDPDDPDPTLLRASDVVAAYAGECNEIERAYLDQNDDFVLKVSDNIPINAVTTDFTENGDGGRLVVRAEPYSYFSATGNAVEWKANKVLVRNKEMTFSDPIWSIEVDGSDGDRISAEYVAELTIQAEDLNKFLNKAYAAGKAASDKIASEGEQYDDRLDAYYTAEAEYEAYLVRLEEYRRAEAEYEAYLGKLDDYNKRVERYDTYLTELAEYEQDEKNYADFYDKVMPRYRETLALYQQYLDEYDLYEKELKEYNAQINSLDAQKAVFHYEIMAYLTKPMTDLMRTLKGAIQGDAVTRVLSERESLKRVGLKNKDIERANNATLALRELFESYDKCTNNEQRYSFYITSYEQLRDNFNELLRILDYMYHGFGMIRNGISSMERTRQFEILLAQLYYVCNALTDGQVENYRVRYPKDAKDYISEYNFDASYMIGPDHSKHTPAEILGEEGLLEDKEFAAPLEGGFPSLPDRPTPPEPVEDPGDPPHEPSRPIRPVEPPEPGLAPQAVDRPVPPDEVLPPELPSEYVPSESQRWLARAYESGMFTEREEAKSPYVMRLSRTVTRYFRNAMYVDVMFFAKEYDPDKPQEPMLVKSGVEAGGAVVFDGRIPVKPKSTQYNFTFDHWVDEDGNAVDLSHIGEGPTIKLYPFFVSDLCEYTVVWTVDGRDIINMCPYGEIPVYEVGGRGEPQKQAVGLRKYRFIGWQSESGKVYQSGQPLEAMIAKTVRYTAVFEETCTIKFIVDGKVTSLALWKGDLPKFDDPVKPADRTYVYKFSGWDRQIERVTQDASYTARFNREYIVEYDGGHGSVSLENGVYVVNSPSANGELTIANLLSLCNAKNTAAEIVFAGGKLTLDAEAVRTAVSASVQTVKLETTYLGYSNKYSLFFGDGVGNFANADGLVAYLETPCNLKKDNAYLTRADGDSLSEQRFYSVTGGVGFRIEPRYEYTLAEQYRVEVVPSEYVTIETTKLFCVPGERVTLSVSEPQAGMYVRSVYARASDGTGISVQNNAFTMPRSSVVVGVVCARAEYTVTFRSDGKTLLVRRLHYGDAVVPPSDPFRPSDETNSYAFAGWLDERGEVVTQFGTVTGNAVYEASYDVSPLEREKLPDTKLNKLIRAASIVLPIIAALAVGLIVFFVVRHLRRKKARKN